MTFVDNDNRVWKALCDLARQPDRIWLIAGRVLVRSTDSATLGARRNGVFLDLLRRIVR